MLVLTWCQSARDGKFVTVDLRKSDQRRDDVKFGTRQISQKAAELAERLLDSGSLTESGRITSIHVGREIFNATVTVKLTKVQ
jgi:hypothetical protein